MFSGSRERGEGLLTFTGRKNAEFVELEREGCALPSLAKGLIVMKLARLRERAQEDMRTWLAGDYSWQAVTRGLHRLESHLQGKSAEVLWMGLPDEEENGETDPFDDLEGV